MISREEANRMAADYISVFPSYGGGHPIELATMIANFLEDKPDWVRVHFLHPEHGAATKTVRPSHKAVVDWYEDWIGRRAHLKTPQERYENFAKSTKIDEVYKFHNPDDWENRHSIDGLIEGDWIKVDDDYWAHAREKIGDDFDVLHKAFNELAKSLKG